MEERWTLNRAGITNVYQYSDEVLDFAGGRLLLRGVNGSGKSTAMNMLLPFLLDADARRIDAAGEQSAVLRSWMLSGRDEAQPVGYLWIEFRRGDERLVCGCGIRANRSTDRVTTWWFVTDRRPGIDFALVEGRVPLSLDALRTVVGSQAVFTHDQRAAYRDEVRARLFGGADLDQHIRLLHVVRSPRVGDRVDVDLPRYLHDALPQLSETAIDDAAQPLEDLEEHRRNVENLTDTAQALEALTGLYRAYARSELHQRSHHAMELVRESRRRRRAKTEAHRAVTEAEETLVAAEHRLATLTDDEGRLTTEISALQSTPAYQAGQQLDDLRRHVTDLDRALSDTRALSDQAGERTNRAAKAVTATHATIVDDHAAVTGDLTDLASAAAAAGLSGRPPDAPGVAGDAEAEVPLPGRTPDFATVSAGVIDVRSDAQRRRGDVADVLASLDAVDRLEETLRQAERDRRRGADDVAAAEEAHAAARSRLAETVDRLRSELAGWWARLMVMRSAIEVDVIVFDAVDGPDLADRLHSVQRAAVDAVDVIADHHRRHLATLEAGRVEATAEVDRLSESLDDLNRRQLPEPPTGSWQRKEHRPCLAEMIDFAPDLAEETRAGVEAAMEAAGLLGAEVRTSGDLVLETGELVVVAAEPVASPLSRLVVASVPDDLAGDVSPDAVAAILASISSDPDGPDPTIVSEDGRFRIGGLVGRHVKPVAEHIGAGARKAALERQREEVAGLLEEARVATARLEEEIAATGDRVAAAVSLRAELPSPIHITEAVNRTALADEHLTTRRDVLDELTRAMVATEAAHADGVASSRRLAATLGLAADRPGLDHTTRTLDEVESLGDFTVGHLVILERSHAAWRSAADEWRRAGSDQAAAHGRHTQAASFHQSAAARLATLEDSVGLEYQDVLASLDVSRADLAAMHQDLGETRSHRDGIFEARARHRAEAEAAAAALATSEESCLAELSQLRRALGVAGLVAAALPPLDPDDPEAEGAPDAFPAVAETPDGLGDLATAIAAQIPGPGDPVTADGVRQSLRRRRDTLGAGWDAEDRQPDESLPVAVEVNGPLGRMPLAAALAEVNSHRDRQASLLTAKQDQALRNLLQGLIAREVTDKLTAATELVGLMNDRLATVSTAHGIGARLRWRRRDDIDPSLQTMIDLLSKPPDLRTADEDNELAEALSTRIADARRADPELAYRDLVGEVLDYRHWHEMAVYVVRPGQPEQRLTRRVPLSEGEKKMVTYLPLFAAVAASCDALGMVEGVAPRFVLLDDAFAKVSEDNHPQLFGLLVEMDLDFIATSERLWGTHATVPALAITEVLRDADLGVIVLEHSRWDGRLLADAP